jgi:hypothetical protein
MAHSTVHKKKHKAEEDASAKRSAPTSVQPEHTPLKPEEARLVGAGSKEQQRLLKKNIEEGTAEGHPDLPAGQHSTGSFTGENEKKK